MFVLFVICSTLAYGFLHVISCGLHLILDGEAVAWWWR